MKLQKNIFFLLTVGTSLATVFMFSCSSDGVNEQNTSSSSDNQSSSSSVIACNGIEYDPYSHYCFEGEKIAKEEIIDARDGKVYKIVTIYTQTWMAENLNYYNASDSRYSSGSRCYDDDPDNCEIFGRLYERELAMEACPQGWHLPSADEWRELINMVGADKLRGINHWEYHKGDPEKTDSYGFSALPGGHKQPDDWGLTNPFLNMGYLGQWWTSSLFDGYDGGYIILIYPSYVRYSSIRNTLTGYIISVRCVK